MDREQRLRLEARAKIMKAMAHPSRLYILEQLSREEHCVCELREGIGADLSTVSKHLSVLREAGIVEMEKRGVQVFYRLKVPCILKFMGCIEAVLERTAREQACLIPDRNPLLKPEMTDE